MSDQEIKENSLEDNFPDIIARFDKSLRYVSINKRVTDELGFPVAHVIGKTMHELRMPVDVIEKWESGIRAVFDEMTIHTVELAYDTPQGRKYYSSRLAPEFTKDGSVTTVFSITRNITELKQATNKLRESEQRFHQLVEFLPLVIGELDMTGSIIYGNRRGFELFGYTQHEWEQGLNFIQMIAHNDRERAIVDAQKVLAGVFFAEGKEYSGLRKDGSEFPILVYSAPKIVDGGINGMRVVVVDIAAQKNAEKAIRESNERTSDLIDKMHNAVFIYKVIDGGENFVFTRINRAAEELDGHLRNEIIGKLITEIIPRAKETGLFKALQSVYRTGDPLHFAPSIYIDPKGRPDSWREAWIYRLTSGEVVAEYNDVTEQKNAEEAVCRLDSAMEQASDGVIIFSAHNRKVVYTNHSYAQMLGYLPDDLLGIKFMNTISRIISGKYKNITITEILNEPLPLTVEIEHIRKDASLFPALVSLAFINAESGESSEIIAVTRDITERKLMEMEIQSKNKELVARNEKLMIKNMEIAAQQQELMRKNQELQEATQAKSEFLASMSHELRTPLNAVIGFSEVMLDGITGEINDEQRECITDILNSGEHLLELINDILDLSKVEAGKMAFKQVDLSIRSVIDEAIQTMKPLLKEKEHSLSIRIDNDIPLVYADRSRLRQVLLNVMSNASKFTPQRGKIKISATKENEYCRVKISDNGIGIKKEDLEKVFQVFTQLETIGEETKKGTGLGLSISRQFIETMGGKIWAESTYGKGSSFIFTIPLSLKAAQDLAEKTIEAGKEKTGQIRKKVLIIDDDEKARKLFSAWLKEEQYTIIEASNADDGVRKAEETTPDVIILDLLMPQKDGWFALQELKSKPKTRAIPVVIASVTEESELAFSLGAVDYFTKPINKSRFQKRIADLGVQKKDEVLIVDDNPNDIHLISKVLETAGIKQISALGGEEGLRIAREKKPSLIVLDILMPDLTGFEVIDELHKDNETKNIPIVILTAKDLTEEEMERLSKETQAIMKKASFNREDFLLQIKKQIDSSARTE